MTRNMILGLLLAYGFFGPTGFAAEPSRELAARGNARPSFQIKPLVHRFSARPGQRLKFSFDVQTLANPQSLRIRAVSLKQQLNGLAVADETGPAADAIQVAGPLQLDLKAQQTATIRGHVDVPRSPAPFHAFGILVTDLGRPFSSGKQPEGGNEAAIAVRFVTQYLLRVEVDIVGGRQENAKELRVEDASLVDLKGRPFVEVDVTNPAKSGVEFQLYCRLLGMDGAPRSPAFGLALPARATRPEPQRYESVVFGQTRVRLSAPVSEAVFPGDYQLELEWLSRGRKCGKAIFPVVVHEGDFAAQASEVAQIGQSVRVTPAQIELSSASGGIRRLPLRVANHSRESVHVHLTILNLDRTVADALVLQPGEFHLPAGRGRNVLVTAQPGSELERHRYGFVRVDVRAGEAAIETRELPFALLVAGPAEPVFETGTLHWDQRGEREGFVLPILNRGAVHLPLHGHLTVIDGSGKRIDIPAGYGRWVLPGQQDELRFPVRGHIAPGTYSVKVEVEKGGLEPHTITQPVQVQ